MYLLDADYLIYFLKGEKQAIEVIKNLQDFKLYTSVICVGEVLEGLYYGKKKKYLKIFKSFLESLNVLDINRQVMEQFALLRGKLRQQGKLLDNFDLLIASTCLVYDLTLVSANKTHFCRIPELKLYRKNSY